MISVARKKEAFYMKDKVRQYKFVIQQLVDREIKRKYARSFLGVLWSVLNPLLSMAVISMIFSTMFARSIENFPIYYLTGQTLWQLFTNATNTGMTALVDNRLLLAKVKLPRHIFVLARVFTALANFMYSLVAYVLMILIFRVEITYKIIVFPIIVLLELLFVIGITYILSVLYVFFGDIKHLYSVILTLWMYVSAIFYPVDGLDATVQSIIVSNPIYGFVASARACVMYGEWPTSFQWIQMLVWSVGIFGLGCFVFQRNQNKIMQKL